MGAQSILSITKEILPYLSLSILLPEAIISVYATTGFVKLYYIDAVTTTSPLTIVSAD